MLACGIGVPREAYGRYQRALAQAVAAGGWTAQIHADIAWGLYLVEGDLDEAQAYLEVSQKEDPGQASPYMCQALVHASHKQFDAALESLDRARTADPLQPCLASTEILVRLCRREWHAAVEAGIEGVKLHPYLHFERTFYGQALEFAGDIQEALAQYKMASAIAPDILWIRALEARCLARNGQRDAAIAIAADLKQIRVSVYVDAYYMALLMDSLGRREEAFQELERAIEEYSTTLYMLHIDPKMDDLRADAWRFSAISARLATRPQCFERDLAEAYD
jgi:tetratricopeptide (TPR) repeat protein